MKNVLRIMVALFAVPYLPASALAQNAPQPPQPSAEEQRATYCIDTARQRDILNNYAQSLQGQVNKLANDLAEAQKKLKGTEDEFDAYKKKFGPPEEKKPEPDKPK